MDDVVPRDVDNGARTRWLCSWPCQSGFNYVWRRFEDHGLIGEQISVGGVENQLIVHSKVRDLFSFPRDWLVGLNANERS